MRLASRATEITGFRPTSGYTEAVAAVLPPTCIAPHLYCQPCENTSGQDTRQYQELSVSRINRFKN